MKKWKTGTGKEISFDEIVDIIVEHEKVNGCVSIGVDSHIKKEVCTFSAAICLHGAIGQTGGRYFIKRTTVPRTKFPALLTRILAEVQESVELGMRLLEFVPTLNIEIHLDVSDSDKGKATSKFTDMLTGYAKGAGFDYKIKPEAFAAMSVADKHSK